MSNETFGRWLKRQRTARSLTQAELARRVACAVITLRKIEADTLRPSYQFAARLIDQFNVPATERSYLITFARKELPIQQRARLQQPMLPIPLSILIDRTTEVAAACDLLCTKTRLLTLTGPGGIGKTRLAIQIAETLSEKFADGMFFLDLTSVSDPTLVLPALAERLGVSNHSAEELHEQIVSEIYGSHILLIIDNFEQVLSSAPQIAMLLAAVPTLKVMVTSRAILHVSCEYVFVVPPLGLPAPEHEPATKSDFLQYSAIALFVERAQASTSRFVLTDANAPTIAKICTQLDGIPLAIELAAARSHLFTPPALLARLNERLSLLTHGALDLPARQQTLRTTFEWSVQLLSPIARKLLQRLAICTGGCSLEAVEALCAMDGDRPRFSINNISELLDHNLIKLNADLNGTQRFTMLKTIHEYAFEQLTLSGELELLQKRHCNYYLALAESFKPQLESGIQAAYLTLEREHDNLISALTWALSSSSDSSLALRLATALWRFWQIRGYYQQGRVWLAAAISAASTQSTQAYAQALHGAGILARCVNDAVSATSLIEQSLVIYLELGDHQNMAQALSDLGGIAVDRSNYGQAYELCIESLAFARQMDAPSARAWALHYLGHVAWWNMDYAKAENLYLQSLALFRTTGDVLGSAYTLWARARNAKDQPDYQAAMALAQESLSLFQRLDFKLASVMSLLVQVQIAQAKGEYELALGLCTTCRDLLHNLEAARYRATIGVVEGQIAELQGSLEAAIKSYTESRHLFHQADDPEGVALSVLSLSFATILQGNALAAHDLLGTYATISQQLGRNRDSVLGICLRHAAFASTHRAQAIAQLEHELALFRNADNQWGSCTALRVLGMVRLDCGLEQEALLCFQEGLRLAHRLDGQLERLIQITGVAMVALHQGLVTEAAQLCGVVDTIQETLGSGRTLLSLWPPDRERLTNVRAQLQNYASDPAVASARAVGHTMPMAAAVDLAMSIVARLIRGAHLQALASTVAFRMRQDGALDDTAPTTTRQKSQVYTLLADDRPIARAESKLRFGTIGRQPSGHMGQLLNKLSAIAHVCANTLQLENIQMEHLVADVFEELTRQSDRSRILLNLGQLPPAHADRIAVREIWMNLISNALTYSASQPLSIIHVRGYQVDSACLYLIQDNGVGFDMTVAHEIFELFQRSTGTETFPGKRLGLAIVKRMVAHHDGSVWAESAPGQGATFFFTLPEPRTHQD